MRTHAPASARKAAVPAPAAVPVISQRASLRQVLRAPRPAADLEVGPPDDVYEREAERVADAVMRAGAAGEGPAPPPEEGTGAPPPPSSPLAPVLQRCSCGGGGGGGGGEEGECATCREKRLQRSPKEAAGADATAEGGVPTSVREVLRSLGRPLEPGVRAFLEPRFGRDFARVRIHDDARAAASAEAVGALAYTVGENVVFGAGRYAPAASGGRRLLAHELTHVVQQVPDLARQMDPEVSDPGPLQRLRSASLQRACKSGGACGLPIPGDPGRFGEKTAKDEEEKRRKSGVPPPAGAPAPCVAPRHKDPATSFRALVTAAGVTPPAEVTNGADLLIFINACLPDSVGSQVELCSNFPDGVPAGAPAGKNCIQVHTEDEDLAKELLKPGVHSEAEKRKILRLVTVTVHESQHAAFDAKSAAVVPAAADCDLNTVVFHGPTPAPAGTDYPVEHYLSEMSAEIAEFAPVFQNSKTSPSKASQDLLFAEERNIALNAGESLGGILKALQCKCECATVDTFTTQVFNDATSAWPADQKLEFQRAMTRIIPDVWPQSLQKT